MKTQQIADWYFDYLLASFGATTATGLSELLEGEISHDQVTRGWASPKKTATDLWCAVKGFVREVQSAQGVWFASAENMGLLKQHQGRDFICPLKANRKVALNKADKHQGRSGRVDTLDLDAQATRAIYLEGVDLPLVLVKQIFTNEDGKSGLRYLVSSETTLSVDAITTTYHTRWGVECYHMSLEQNVSLAKSPTQTVPTHTNHFFAALCGFVKLERLKMKTQLNHLALKSKLCLNALHSAFATLRTLTADQVTA